MKKVLVTGANGRIGRHVVPLLVREGYQVTAAARRELSIPDVRWLPLSLPAKEPLAEALDGFDAIVHLAGIMPPAGDDEIFGTNIQGTYQILQAAAALKKKPRVLFATSDATYCTGWSLGSYSAPIEEDSSGQHPTVFYGLSKVIGERMCAFYEEMHQVPIVRLRYVWTLEAPEILDLFLKAPYKDFLIEEDRGKWEDGMVAVPREETGAAFSEHVCDVRDAAEATVLAVRSEAAVGQAINIAGPEPFFYTEAGPKLAAEMGVRWAEGRCRGIHSYGLSIEKARKLLGYRPRYGVMDSLKEALLNWKSPK